MSSTETPAPTPAPEVSPELRTAQEELTMGVVNANLDTEIPPGVVIDSSHLIESNCLIWRFPGGKDVKSFTREPSMVLRSAGLVESSVQSKWTIPNRGELVDYKNKCQRINASTGEVYLDLLAMQDTLLRHHLINLSWVGASQIAKELVSLKQKNGRLDKDSVEGLSELHPTLIDLLYAGYLQEANLIF